MNRRFNPGLLIIGLSLLFNLFSVHSTQACTVFCIDKGDSLVVGRNQDWTFGEGMIVVNKRNQMKTSLLYWGENETHPARWTSKYGSITFVQYGREIAFGGMNEAGLVVNELWLEEAKYPAVDARASIGIDQVVQYLLDNFQSVEELSSGISDIRLRPNGFSKIHFIVIDRKGDSIVIEFLNGKTVIHAKAAVPVKALTNETYERSLNYIQGNTLADISPLGRFATAASLVSKYKPDDKTGVVQYAFDILRAVGQGSYTKFQVVFDVRNRVIYFKTLRSSTMRYFSFDRFDFSPKTPSKVLDANAELSGDVTAEFMDYSTTINENLVKKAYGDMGFNFSPEAVKQISHYPDTFINQ